MFGSIGSALGISPDAAFGGVTSAAGAIYQNQEAKRAAKRQMQFQAEMSNTGYQRAMRDMKAAGLNPILAGKLGPASSPGGAMYQPGNIGQAFVQGAQGISSAKQSIASASVSEATVQKIETEVSNMKDLHNERWQRLFATMGPDNIAASVAAVLNNVSIEQVLKNAKPKTHANSMNDLRRLLNATRAQKSAIATGVAGLEDIIRQVFKGD